MSDEDIQIRAARAQQLLEDEVLVEAVDKITLAALERATMANLADAAECVACVAAIQAVNHFVADLKSFVTSGRAAERKPFRVA
jgi:mannose-1-phosphate guanylyltransferase